MKIYHYLVCIVFWLSFSAQAALITYEGRGGRVPESDSHGLFTSSLVVNDHFEIVDVTIRLLGLAHSFECDLDIRISHLGHSASLVSRLGVINDNGDGACGGYYYGDYFFNDSYPNNLWDLPRGVTVPSGDYVPTGMYGQPSSLDTFTGLSVAGVWQLSIVDFAYQDIGSLNGWQLVVETVDVPEPSSLAILSLGIIVFGLFNPRRGNGRKR